MKTEEDFAPNYENKKSKKKEKLVWFRLVNNSTCPIFVPTIESPENLENESKVLVVFKLDSTVRTSYMSMGFNPATKNITEKTPKDSILLGGNSIYFAVPLKYFNESYAAFNGRKNYWNISIPFKYVDQESEKNYEPFYFSRNDLPKEILK